MPKNEHIKMNIKSIFLKTVLFAFVLLLLFTYSKYDTKNEEYTFNNTAFLYEGDQLVGVNTNEQADELDTAQTNRAQTVTEEANTTVDDAALSTKVVKTPSLINFNLSEAEQAENINYATKQTKVLEEGYTVIIDNAYKYYVTDVDTLDWVKEKLLLAYLPDQSYLDYYNAVGSFKPYTVDEKKFTGITINNDIKVKEGYITGSKYIDNQEDLLFDLFHKDQNQEYEMISDDASINTIKDENEMSDTLFKLDNPNLNVNTVTYNGQKVITNDLDPILEVVETYETVEEKKVDYETVQEVDDSLSAGQFEMESDGEEGTKEITYENKMVNGKVISTEKIKTVVTKAPVHRVIRVGAGSDFDSESLSEALEAGPSSGAVPNSDGFVWPSSSKNVTCPYGCYGGHTGFDIQSYMGGPIYAAKAGIVTTSGWSNIGYGYYVVIDHGNGMKTLYAHQKQQPPVSVGQYVEAGQMIGYEGNTGNVVGVTGIHLHFEVQINGTPVDPYPYIS